MIHFAKKIVNVSKLKQPGKYPLCRGSATVQISVSARGTRLRAAPGGRRPLQLCYIGTVWPGARQKGQIILHRLIARRLRMLQHGAVLSILSICECLCIMLPASAFASQLGANTYITFSYSVLRFFWGRVDFAKSSGQEA